MDKLCFLFGSRMTPHHILPDLEATLESLYLDHGVRYFLVGHRGNFDQLAATAVKKLKQKYRDITLDMLLAYHPVDCPIKPSKGFDGAYYPEGMERVPRRVAIMQANRLGIAAARVIVCYVNSVGNSRTMLEYAQSHQKIRPLTIINLAETRKGSPV